MVAKSSAGSDDDEYIFLREPYTTGGYAVKWQCELSKTSLPLDEPHRWWVDYEMNYNIVSEAAFQNKQSEALLEGPTSEEGDWKCNLQTLVQTNTMRGTTRRMRRSVVTMQG
jgi:hypothetical protein